MTKQFTYLSHTFMPANGIGNNGSLSFVQLSKMIGSHNMHPFLEPKDGWSWEAFYEKAAKACSSYKNIDVFECDGKLCIPSGGCLWKQ